MMRPTITPHLLAGALVAGLFLVALLLLSSALPLSASGPMQGGDAVDIADRGCTLLVGL